MKGCTIIRIKSYWVVGAAIFIGVVQIISFGTDKVWPFNEIRVYRKFPSNYKKFIFNAVVMTKSGEVDVALLDNINWRIAFRHTWAIRNIKDSQRCEVIARQLCEYIAMQQGESFEFLGVRFYKLQLNLKLGKIAESTLIYEFYK